jgi:DegV family protein with EDD domain
MSKVAIVTDSTAYLPENLLQEYDIHTLPLKVIWGEESLDDGIDITPVQFYERLAISDSMPTTSQVTIGEFKTLFEKLHGEGKEILAVLISNELSGTMASAIQAVKEVPGAVIELFDSQSTILELAFQVLVAARAAKDGASLAECLAALETARVNSGVVFAVDTLEFLHRGGRIGGAKKFLATVLAIKPILTVEEGKVAALDQARTRKKSIARLVEIVAERAAGKQKVRIGVSHASALPAAQKLLESASAALDPVETLITDLSPVIGTHVGPGTLALAYHFEE